MIGSHRTAQPRAVGQDDLERIGGGRRHHRFGFAAEQWLVFGLHESFGRGVRQDDALVGKHHRALRAAALSQELSHHDAFDDGGVVDEPPLDVAGGATSKGQHQRARFSYRAREIDDTEDLSGTRIHDRRGGARKGSQRIGEVLAPAYERRPAGHDRSSDSVRPDRRLRVDESRGEMDSIKTASRGNARVPTGRECRRRGP